MPKRRRAFRPVRRPNFQPAPPAPAEDSLAEGEAPVFAEEPPIALPGLAAGGPVETRPHWVARDQRAQGRRMAQLRRSSGEERGIARASGPLPTFDTRSLPNEMRQIMITTAGMVGVLVALAFLIR